MAWSLAEICEEDASGNQTDDGGRLVGLCADDAGARGPKESGDREDTVKPVGRRGRRSADDTGAGREQSGPESGQQETSKQMKA